MYSRYMQRYEARLRDVVCSRALVSFAGGVWPDREAPQPDVFPQYYRQLIVIN